MKIAIIADSHFDERSRFDECVRVHQWIANDASNRGCSAWLHTGDVYERRSTPAERQAAISWVERMQESVGSGVIVRGNHDAPIDLWPFGRLETDDMQHTVQAVEEARVVDLNGVRIQCLPWPNRANLLGNSREQSEQNISNALRDILRGLSLPRGETPRILLSHAMVRGSVTSTGQPLVGCDCEIGLEDLALCESDFYALGHIHAHQHWIADGSPVVYPGSPRRTAFGEVEPKGYVVVEFDGPNLVNWEFVETPCAPMLLVEGEWYPAAGAPTSGVFIYSQLADDVSCADIRLRYSVTQEHRQSARAEALAMRDKLLSNGALSVKLEELVSVDTRARAPEIATARTLDDQLNVYWSSQVDPPDIDQRARLLAKLHTLQANQ